MKKILTIAALLIGYFSYAIGPVTYYVKFGGNDAANGLSDVNAWGTIAKVNGFTFATGDTIKFKQGDTFYGSIVVPASNLVFTSYGTGAKPLITGFTTLSGWTNAGGGIWNISASAVKNTVNMVTMNGVAQEVGRYPNSDAANGGYLTNDTFFTNTRYKCAALNGTNWTGAEVVARLHGYRVERNTISSQSVDTITYSRTIGEINPRYNGVSASPAIPPSKGFGMFIQRDIRTLDKLGEWYFNPSTKVMSMFFGAGSPTSYTINVSTLDTIVNINNQNNITINNIAFEGGNLYGIFFKDGSNRTITNCSFNNSGYKAISGWYSFNTLIDGNTVNNSMSGGIEVRAGATNITVTNNTVTNTGMLKGMSSFYDAADCNAIYIVSNAIARHNNINNVGYCGIRFEDTNNNVDSNYINNYCQVRNDGGAIYTYFTRAANSTINNNIITNGGYPIEGTQEFVGSHGLYLDGGAGGITINNNTVSGVPGVNFAASFGYFFNSPKNIVATNNTLYNGNGWYYGRLQNENNYGFIFKKNIIFTTASDRVIMLHTNAGLDQTTTPVVSTIQQSLQQMGTIDSNYYNMPNTAPFSWYYAPTTGGTFTGITTANFATWNSYTSNDIHTVASNSSAYQLQYNATNSATTFNFAGLSKKDVAGTVYNNSATIPAWGSKILIDNGTTGTPPTVNPAVVVTGCINCIITNQIPKN